jgi:hypothetical protein
VLDVGIGTGLALVRNLDLIVEKRLVFTGVDYDKDYVERCEYFPALIQSGIIICVAW